MGEAFQVHGSWKTEVRVQEPCQGEMFVRDKGEGGASRGGRGFTWKMLPLGWDCQKGRGRKGGKKGGRGRERGSYTLSLSFFVCKMGK